MKLKVVSRDATSVVVDYMDGTQKIPLAARPEIAAGNDSLNAARDGGVFQSNV